MTDTLAMIAHFVFLQISAFILFLNNLSLGPELTKLVGQVMDFNFTHGETKLSTLKLKIFRYSICALCTAASAVLFTGLWNIIAMDDHTFGFYDFALILIIVIALYVENQVQKNIGLSLFKVEIRWFK